MRNPKRIKEILELIEKIWIEYPDLRLTQLIGNCFPAGDLYYKDDNELENRLKEVYSELSKDKKKCPYCNKEFNLIFHHIKENHMDRFRDSDIEINKCMLYYNGKCNSKYNKNKGKCAKDICPYKNGGSFAMAMMDRQNWKEK